MGDWRKLGIIAGGGELPVVLAEHCASNNASYFVARVAPYADAALEAHPGATQSLGAMGARMAALRDAGCDAVVLIGQVLRQDPRGLDLDEGGLAMVPDLLASAPNGDDALLRVLVDHHEKAGFRVVGVEEAMIDLLAQPGVWGEHAPTQAQRKDIAKAARLAAAIGAYDVGQGVVVCEGLVLAVEAQEGTDRMLARVAELPEAVRGNATTRRGVLVKRPKPIQERRIDMPTIGVRTIEGAIVAGLAGVAVEAGGALAVKRGDLIKAADRAGLFVYGFTLAEVGEA